MNKKYPHALSDSLFERGDVPMTKEEVRTLVVSRLMLHNNAIMIDVGAGTGSVSIAAAQIINQGRVYAVEKHNAAIDLINKNIKKFAVSNITLLQGEAPEVLTQAGSFSRAFIGGSGGRLKEILIWLDEHIEVNGLIVTTAITLDTLIHTREFFTGAGYELDIIHVAVTRIRQQGSLSMFSALTPVYIITAKKVRT